MSKKQFKIGASSQVNIERCDGHLTLRGGTSGVIVYDSKGVVDLNQVGDEIVIRAESDCSISVPQNIPVVVQTVSGQLSAKVLQSLTLNVAGDDVKVEGVSGLFSVGSLRGDLEVRKSNKVSVHTVSGEVEFKEVYGDIQIVNARDNFSGRKCHGKIEVDHIHGNVHVSEMKGVLKLNSVGGEVALQGPLSAGKHHIITAKDVVVHWPLQSKVQFLITHAGKLFNKLNLKNNVSKEGEFQATIGDDSCKLIIDSKEDVFLWPFQQEKNESNSKSSKKAKSKSKKKKPDFDLDLEDLLDPEELIEKVGKGIKSMVKGRKNGQGLFSKIFDSAMQEVDEWAGVPEEREARKRAAQSQTEQPQKANPDSEEERRIILKMLENGAITVDEAAKRLKNL